MSNSIDINPQVSINMNKNVKTLNSDTALQEKSTIQEAFELILTLTTFQQLDLKLYNIIRWSSLRL